MDRIKMTCQEIEIREEGYAVVSFNISAIDETIYADATPRIMVHIEEAEMFKMGKMYGLDLKEI